MARIIMVGEDSDLRRILLDHLGRAGHQADWLAAGSGLEALLEAGRSADLFVLDVRPPAAEALGLVGGLRDRMEAGIVLITGAGAVRSCAPLPEADDWIAASVAPAELVARVDAVLRRRRRAEAESAVAFGPYRLDLRAFDVLDGAGRSLRLQPMEVDLAAAFATNPGRVLTRDDLLRLAPPRTEASNGRSIDHRVTRLRRKLERDPSRPELIRTVRGVGYVFPGTGRPY